MRNLDERPVRVLKAVAMMSYGTAAIILAGIVLILATWQWRWPVVRNCSGMAVISAGFVFAAIRNQRMVRKRDAEAVNAPGQNPDGAPESN